jgi:hypothetical protein
MSHWFNLWTMSKCVLYTSQDSPLLENPLSFFGLKPTEPLSPFDEEATTGFNARGLLHHSGAESGT